MNRLPLRGPTRGALRLAFCAALITTTVAVAACRHESAEEVETTSPVAVRTAAVETATIRASVRATGVVTPAPDAELIVVAPEAARVAEVPHAAGERVRRGDLLVRFEIPSSAAEVEKQQAEVTRAEAGLANATAARTRAQGLFDRGVAARREVEDATRGVADAEAAVAQAQAALKAARAVEQRATVRATFDGVVAKRFHNPGDLVEAAASDPVLRVVDPARLEVVAAVPLTDATLVRIGAAARLVGPEASDATPTTGAAPVTDLTVKSLPTLVEAGTATVPVRLGLKGGPLTPFGIPLGTPVQVDIAAEEHHDVLAVPTAAVVREADETAVFVVTGGKAQRRPVRVGLTDGTRVEIVSGLSAGDRVIVDGQAGLPDGAPVTEGSAGAPAPEKDAGR